MDASLDPPSLRTSGRSYPREAAHAVINTGYPVASWCRPDGDVSTAEIARRYCELALATVRARQP